MFHRLPPALIVLVCCVCLLAAEPASKPATTSAPAKVTIDQSSPKALLLSAHQATVANDYDALMRCVNPAMRPFVEMGMEMERTTGHLFALMDKKFGKAGDEFKKRAVFGGGGTGLVSPLATAVVNGNVDWAKVSIEEQGDKAKIVVGGESSLAKKIEGKWYWFGAQELGPDDIKDGLQRFRKTLATVKAVCQGLEKGLENGSITKDNFDQELEKLTKAATGTE
jgi:hypothetical protein